MLKAIWIFVFALFLSFVLTAPASAYHTHHGAGKHRHAAKIRYGGAPGRGYWRPGPLYGYGFGFATYKGDPYGKDDYFDGGRCYYRHHRNYCVRTQIFTGFRP